MSTIGISGVKFDPSSFWREMTEGGGVSRASKQQKDEKYLECFFCPTEGFKSTGQQGVVEGKGLERGRWHTGYQMRKGGGGMLFGFRVLHSKGLDSVKCEMEGRKSSKGSDF